MMNIFFYDTIIGRIGIAECDGKITNLYFNREDVPLFASEAETLCIRAAASQLYSYFSGECTEFSLPLVPTGSLFMQDVWREVRQIPYGKTASYKDIAVAIGKPRAARAVGLAINKNPIPIFIPCHRVIGSNGKLTGYSGGLELKQKLLNLEQGFLPDCICQPIGFSK